MIKRRSAAAAGLPPSTCCHTFRATGITAYLSNGGTLEHAQQIDPKRKQTKQNTAENTDAAHSKALRISFHRPQGRSERPVRREPEPRLSVYHRLPTMESAVQLNRPPPVRRPDPSSLHSPVWSSPFVRCRIPATLRRPRCCRHRSSLPPAASRAERVCPRLSTCRMTTAQIPAADVDHGVLPHLAAPPQERPRRSSTFPQLQGTPLPPSSAFAPQVPPTSPMNPPATCLHSLRRPGLTSPLTANSPPPPPQRSSLSPASPRAVPPQGHDYATDLPWSSPHSDR